MKNLFLIFSTLIFLNGCAQNAAMLGPVLSTVSAGTIQQAVISQGFNYGVKKQTGKSVSEHALSSLEKDMRDCENIHSNELNKIFFKSLDEIDCKQIN